MKRQLLITISLLLFVTLVFSSCQSETSTPEDTEENNSGFILSIQNNVTSTSGVTANTTEAGGTTTFTVKLAGQPADSVTIPVSSSDESEGTVNPSTLNFTTANWNAEQTVTVTGKDDDLQDGNQGYQVVLGKSTSTDSNYNDLDVGVVSITNIDDESAGFLVGIPNGNTTESGGSASFTVKLTSQPTGDVSFDVSSEDTGEGTVSPSRLTFTNQNWNAVQTITVTGVDDNLADGNQLFTIDLAAANSSDTDYDELDPADVTLCNIDNDSAGFVLGDISGDTSESGATATFTVKLASQPTADVEIDVSSDDTGEGIVSPLGLTFTDQNWNTAQTVSITGVNDDLIDGNQGYTIVLSAATSGDSNYHGLNPVDVSLRNIDDDTAGFIVGAISGQTTEAGGTATFIVKLTTQPSANVTIPLSSSDTGEGTISVSSLMFTPGNWNSNQTVTVTGQDDALNDDDQIFAIVLDAASSEDTDYHGLVPTNVSVTNYDDENPGFEIGEISGNTTEAGGNATFTVKLISQPTADVTIAVSSSDTSEGTVSPSSLVFTDSDWNSNQTVTIAGQDDSETDGNQTYSIILAAAVSDDVLYSGLDPNDVSLVNADNEIQYLADTGQTESFTDTFGEDHDYSSIPMSFTDHGDGTVTDNNTLLMWQQTDTNASWDGAIYFCNELTLGGYEDWRLPYVKELQSLVNYGNASPSIDPVFFPTTTSDYFWTNTTNAYSWSSAWRVRFVIGHVGNENKNTYHRYRCVRKGNGGSDIWPLDFLDNGDGTVLHQSTGLTWQKTDDDIVRVWEDALTYCENLSLGGFEDWRLPNVRELQTIVDYSKLEPAIDSTFFPDTNSLIYWSSSSCTGNLHYSWAVGFYAGSISMYLRSQNSHVRCVRGGL